MKFAIVVALFVLAAPAFAHPIQPYVFVVSQAAPASDVVFGMNFAAAMKQAAGVDFSGATDEETEDMRPDETLTQTFVLFNGEDKYALVLTHDDTPNAVRQLALSYLEGKEIKTVLFEDGVVTDSQLDEYPEGYELTQDDMLVQALDTREVAEEEQGEDEDTRVSQEEQPEEEQVNMPQKESASVEEVLPQYREPVTPEQQDDTTIEEAPVVDDRAEEPANVFARFFSWIGSLFS